MCGIVALLLNDQAVDPARLDAGIAALDHRGPDGRGSWLSGDGRTALGHARLSIIDLEGGTQPIASEDGRTTIVVNGEFYGYEAIQDELRGQGHRLATHSDSEIALHLYEDRGVDCLSRLRGEFAFAIWDDRKQQLIAARDRFGIKPLYYAERPEGVYIASEAKALFALGVPAAWDHDAFYLNCHRPLNDSRTLFAGVRRVPPGHYLTATRGGEVRLTRYWDWYQTNSPQSDNVGSNNDEADQQSTADRLAEGLEEAVRLRLRADVPVAVYLSGGIDSSAVLGLAAKHVTTPLEAYTISFGGSDSGKGDFDDGAHFDETAIAKETAQHCGAHFNPIAVNSRLLAENFATAVTHSETLHWNPHGVAKFLLSQAVRQAGIKVVLTGEGADELLLGYSWFQLDHLQPYDNSTGPGSLARTLKLILGLTLQDEAAECQAIDFLTTGIRDELGFTPWSMIVEAWFANHLRGLMTSDFREQRSEQDPFRAFVDGLRNQDALRPLDVPRKSAYLWAKSAFPNYILNVLADRMEMANSIEGRVPFLDHRLVEQVQGAPLTDLFEGRTGKQALRTACGDVLTETVRKRRKLPFVTPPARAGGADHFSEMIQDELHGTTLESLPFFDATAVRQFLNTHTQEDLPSKWAYGQSRILTQIASACVLQRSYGL